MSSALRKDIQAYRFLAVTTVVLFHAGLQPFKSGFIGVDVFFVISGYLIIGLLNREFQKTGKVNLIKFFGRRARRLIPAASIVLVATAIGTYLLLPGNEGTRAYQAIAAASFYFANLHFAQIAMDYWATDSVSPAIHFWSLGVEEQFYILFPIILFVILTFGRAHKAALLRIALVVIMFASFALMMQQMNSGSSFGFYGPLGRAWEFALGGLVATYFEKFAPSNFRFANPFGWVALAGVLQFALFNDPRATFPYWSTIIPVVSTSYLLWLGSDGTVAKSALRFWHNLKPVQAIGLWSYSLYLWHWPILYFGVRVLQPGETSPEKLQTGYAIVLVFVAVVLAALSQRFVETPVRNFPSLVASGNKSLAVGLSLSALVTALSLVVPQHLPQRFLTQSLIGNGTIDQVAITNDRAIEDLINRFSPDAQPLDSVSAKLVKTAQADLPTSRKFGCHNETNSPFIDKECTFGAGGLRVALFGNSHANQFFDPLKLAVADLGGTFFSATKSGCPAPDLTYVFHDAVWDDCNNWHKKAMPAVDKFNPDVVVIVSSTLSVIDPQTSAVATSPRADELRAQATKDMVTRWTSNGAKVIYLRDTPFFKVSPVDCLSSRVVSACDQALAPALPPTSTSIDIVRGMPGVTTVDATPLLCSNTICPATRAGVIEWRDKHHITSTYAEKLTPFFEALLKQVSAKN